MKSEKWKVITPLVRSYLDNIDGVRWVLGFDKYQDETKKILTGDIGYLTPEGIIVVKDPKKHKVIITRTDEVEYAKGKGVMVWLEKEEE